MSDIDAISKDFMRDRNVFAEVFNMTLHGGRRVIRAEDLQEADPNLVNYISSRRGRQTQVRQHDLLKFLAAWRDRRQVYLMLGIEGQSEIDYAMPLRVMEYDVMKYNRQIREIAGGRNDGGGSFTSLLKRGEKLMPVITVVVYFGTEPWDGPRCLHDMLDIDAAMDIGFAVPDYPLFLLEPARLTDEQVAFFQTEFRNVVQILRHAKDPDALFSTIRDDESFHRLDRTTAAFILALTGLQIPMTKNRKGKINMLPAFAEMFQKIEKRGEKRGEKKGEERGEKRGEERGEKRGKKIGEKIGEVRGEKRGRLETKRSLLTSVIQYQLRNNTSIESIISMLTDVFKLSPAVAKREINQICKG